MTNVTIRKRETNSHGLICIQPQTLPANHIWVEVKQTLWKDGQIRKGNWFCLVPVETLVFINPNKVYAYFSTPSRQWIVTRAKYLQRIARAVSGIQFYSWEGHCTIKLR